MKDRIKKLRKELGLTQEDFAEKIQLKRNTITTWEMGTRVPGERVINDICRIFNVNKDWLCDGKGNMFNKSSNEEQIAMWVNDLLSEEKDEFKIRLISALTQLNDEQWKLVEDMARKLLDEQNKSKSDGHPDTPEELEKLYPPVDIKNKDVG